MFLPTFVPTPAFSAGYDRGCASATWVEIDSAAAARRILDGFEDNDYRILELCPEPLSGEWAGESIDELCSLYGLDLIDDEIAGDFCDGFADGFWATVCKRATAMLPTAADLFSEAGFTAYRWDGFDYRADSATAAPVGGDRAPLSNFSTLGTPTHFEMPVTLWGDYCGSDIGRSNHRSLLRDFPDTFVDVYGDYYSKLLLIPVTVSVEIAEQLVEIGTDLAEQYPLYDESDHSMLEMELAEAAWDLWVHADLRNDLYELFTGPEFGWNEQKTDSVLDAIDPADLRERFFSAVGDTPQPYYCESADSVVFPYFSDVVAVLADHYGQ